MVTTADVGNDGTEELLLEFIGFGQGELEVDAGLVSLRDGQLQSASEFDDVYDNPCGKFVDPGRGRVTASRITYSTSGLLVERYEARCTASDGGNVPALNDFKRVK